MQRLQGPQYIRLALIGRKLGLQTFIVVEKPSELRLVMEEARSLGVTPGLGVRMRLASLGAGKWQNSGGDKAKFGLSPRQVLDLWKQLRDAGMGDCLQLLHFHMGSQISNVRDIANGMREATRYFVELCRSWARRSPTSTSAAARHRLRRHAFAQLLLDQLRHRAVRLQHRAAAGRGLRGERDRAAAHRHRMRARDDRAPRGAGRERVGGGEAPEGRVPPEHPDEPLPIRHLREIHAELDQRPAVEVCSTRRAGARRRPGVVRARPARPGARARIDDLFYAIAHAVKSRLTYDEKSHRDLLDELNERLVDKYFVNFSVFESMPDVWAIDQVFPIVPISRLDEEPARAASSPTSPAIPTARSTPTSRTGPRRSLPLHALRKGERYCLGFFLVGAYQEILGDIHNLFGDTDAIEVRIEGDGCRIVQQRRGDTVDVMLDYVGYKLDDLRRRYKAMVGAVDLSKAEAERMNEALERGLTAYTYLSDEPLE